MGHNGKYEGPCAGGKDNRDEVQRVGVAIGDPSRAGPKSIEHTRHSSNKYPGMRSGSDKGGAVGGRVGSHPNLVENPTNNSREGQGSNKKEGIKDIT